MGVIKNRERESESWCGGSICLTLQEESAGKEKLAGAQGRGMVVELNTA